MKGALAARLADGRLHLQHGPIDVIVELFATPEEVELGYRQAAARFRSVLDGLVAELGVLRKPLGETYPFLRDPIGRTMVQVAWPHRRVFVTPMAAVAGAVADAVLAAMPANQRAQVSDLASETRAKIDAKKALRGARPS